MITQSIMQIYYLARQVAIKISYYNILDNKQILISIQVQTYSIRSEITKFLTKIKFPSQLESFLGCQFQRGDNSLFYSQASLERLLESAIPNAWIAQRGYLKLNYIILYNTVTKGVRKKQEKKCFKLILFQFFGVSQDWMKNIWLIWD